MQHKDHQDGRKGKDGGGPELIAKEQKEAFQCTQKQRLPQRRGVIQVPGHQRDGHHNGDAQTVGIIPKGKGIKQGIADKEEKHLIGSLTGKAVPDQKPGDQGAEHHGSSI